MIYRAHFGSQFVVPGENLYTNMTKQSGEETVFCNVIAAALDAMQRATWEAVVNKLEQRYKLWDWHGGIEDFIGYCRAQARGERSGDE